MRWDFVVTEWVVRLAGDAQLVSILTGLHIYSANANRPVKVPSVEYIMVGDTESENFNPIQVQVDIFARGIRRAGLIEKRVRLLTHSDVGQVLGGERMWLQYQDARTVDFPSDPGVIHRIVDFQFTPLRGVIAA